MTVPVSDNPSQLTRILVVDDEPRLLTYIKASLEVERYPRPLYKRADPSYNLFMRPKESLKQDIGDVEVTLCSDGVAAQKRLEINPYDLLITDVMMPEINGFELLYWLRRSDQLARLPVIMLTGIAPDSQGLVFIAEEFLQSRTAYLTKPFSGDSLILRVGEVMRLVRDSA